jgi:hypothetical protein
VLKTLAAAGAELIVGGHIHQAAVGTRREFEVVEGGDGGTVVSIAPGLGRPRPQRLGEARGLQVYEIAERTLTVETYLWRGAGPEPAARRVFPRS